MVGKPSWIARTGRESFRRGGSGQEALPKGRERLGAPSGEP